MDSALKDVLDRLGKDFARSLAETLADETNPLTEAMAYSLKAGGKRLRPLLFLMAAKTYQGSVEILHPFALGIEMIHTYSLIHDDLPAMDNDDYRRGLPTCHKKYGEAMAILAGDGLLTEAFAQMASLRYQVDPARLLQAIEEMACFAGIGGMVKGQMLDISGEGKALTLEELQEIHFYKTGALIKASLTAGAILGGAPEEDIACFRSYGEELGLAFQITDDILDQQGNFAELGKPVGSDMKQHKTTYISLLGFNGAEEEAKAAVLRGKEKIGRINKDVSAFCYLADYVLTRKK